TRPCGTVLSIHSSVFHGAGEAPSTLCAAPSPTKKLRPPASCKYLESGTTSTFVPATRPEYSASSVAPNFVDGGALSATTTRLKSASFCTGCAMAVVVAIIANEKTASASNNFLIFIRSVSLQGNITSRLFSVCCNRAEQFRLRACRDIYRRSGATGEFRRPAFARTILRRARTSSALRY